MSRGVRFEPVSPWKELNEGKAFRQPTDEEMHHVGACCSYHGCVFGEPETCPVFRQETEQAGNCEDCETGNLNRDESRTGEPS